MADPFSNLVQLFSSLFIVLGLIALAAYLAKRFLRSGISRWRTAPLIHVLSTAHLGPKREISIIEIGNEYLVVGITPNQISLITRLEPSQVSAHFPERVKDLAKS